jgi:hypothetical protein
MKTKIMKQRKRYTDGFKSQALELCATGKPVAEVARFPSKLSSLPGSMSGATMSVDRIPPEFSIPLHST